MPCTCTNPATGCAVQLRLRHASYVWIGPQGGPQYFRGHCPTAFTEGVHICRHRILHRIAHCLCWRGITVGARYVESTLTLMNCCSRQQQADVCRQSTWRLLLRTGCMAANLAQLVGPACAMDVLLCFNRGIGTSIRSLIIHGASLKAGGHVCRCNTACAGRGS